MPVTRAVGARLLAVAATVVTGLLACAGLLAALSGPVPAALAAPAAVGVIYPGGAGCTTSLQACIDNASPGTTIVVQPNTYVTDALNLNKAVSLTGVSSATVILQALPNQRLLTISGAAVDGSVLVSGFTLENGEMVGPTCPTGCGGAILITGTAQPRLSNLSIRNNQAGFGGGLYAGAGSPLLLTNVFFSNNISLKDGAGLDALESVTVNGGRFEQNQCVTLCMGGALATGGGITLTGVSFINNTALGFGVAVAAADTAVVTGGSFELNHCLGQCATAGLYLSSGAVRISGTRFLSNSSYLAGGALNVPGIADINGAWFQNNSCSEADCSGGAVTAAFVNMTNTRLISNSSVIIGGALFAGGVHIQGSLFQGNKCTAVFCSGGALAFHVDPTLISDTLFVDNNATGYGGALMGTAVGSVINTRFISNHGLLGGAVAQIVGEILYANDLFAVNQASGSGNALYIYSTDPTHLRFDTIASPTVAGGAAITVITGTLDISDTLIASQTVGIDNEGGLVSEDYNLFGGVGVALSGTVTSAGHSLTGTTAFVDPAAGNYHLRRGSAAINAAVDVGLYFDIDGDPRPLQGGFDIGFDEAHIYSLFLALLRR